LRYSRALFEGFEALRRRPLSTRTAEQVCTTIKGVEMSVRRTPGTTLRNDRTGETIYTPPEGEALLRDLLANWERYLHNETELDPLIRMAVGHYQFEAIHPFTDGNGRTGRVLNSLFLIEEGLLTLPVLYLSRYIINHKADYYRLLLQVTREQDWESWLLYILKGVEQTASWTTGKIAAIRALSEQTAAHVRARLPKVYSHELVSLLFEMPYCRIGSLTERGIAKRQTASVYLKQLVDIGVLKSRRRAEKALHPPEADAVTDPRRQQSHGVQVNEAETRAERIDPSAPPASASPPAPLHRLRAVAQPPARPGSSGWAALRWASLASARVASAATVSWRCARARRRPLPPQLGGVAAVGIGNTSPARPQARRMRSRRAGRPRSTVRCCRWCSATARARPQSRRRRRTATARRRAARSQHAHMCARRSQGSARWSAWSA
jgi:hypothetical protein